MMATIQTTRPGRRVQPSASCESHCSKVPAARSLTPPSRHSVLTGSRSRHVLALRAHRSIGGAAFPITPSIQRRCQDSSIAERIPGCAPFSVSRQPHRVVSTASKASEEERPIEDAEETEEEKGWGVLKAQEFDAPWDVPWGVGTVVFGMVLWAVGFVASGFIALLLEAQLIGPEALQSASATEQSEFFLLNQVLETFVSLGSIALVAGKFTLPDDVLKISLAEPFKKPRGWAFWAFWGFLVAPLVVGLTDTAVSTLGYDMESGRGTVDEVVKMVDNGSSPSFWSLLIGTGFLAPVLEETVFRGFLLASLTKLTPTPVAIAISSTLFGLAHFSPRDFPQLVALGAVLSLSYLRSRNLVTPMIIHGTWNSTVLLIFFALASSGVSVEEYVRGAPESVGMLQALLHCI